jgi:dihydropteroate synthase
LPFSCRKGYAFLISGAMKNPEVSWTVRGRELDLSRNGLVMGVLNVTPDSFSDGGAFVDAEQALAQARRMIAEGVDIIDVGGESTRPGADPVEEDEELRRVRPVVEALRKEWSGLISIDTAKARVAEVALHCGADIVNDVTGLRGDERMAAVCRESGAGVVVMHMKGEPRTMQVSPDYGDVVTEVRAFFEERFETLTAGGIEGSRICFDPGIGFGKRLEHNLTLLASLARLGVRDRPLLVGVSRKSFIGMVLDRDGVGDREWPTVALTAYAREKGAMIHRVHSVRENREAMHMVEAVMGCGIAIAIGGKQGSVGG